eukprot:TRINITY_DN5534_c0_g5_i4.p1 TRINITY_DN5534_c0_g5~~TRINITY_DN5534_c0_g5_i4.p1  ORF type:complete len:478 (-),score=50.27 TRINITY_DN5534_c0_g5_i4:595-2028(-)
MAYIAQLSSLDEDNMELVLREKRTAFWENLNNLCVQNDLKSFYGLLDNMTSYTQFDKRDGSIVNVIKEGKDIITDDKMINQALLSTLIDTQGIDNSEPENTLLPPLSIEETLRIMASVSNGKAILYDLLSDSLFHCAGDIHPNHFSKLVDTLANAWTIPLDVFPKVCFEARLVPLNKVHPEIPTKKDFRPIIVMSPLIKFLEARFASRLMGYCVKHLHRSQVGFVQQMGCDVNLYRLTKRIAEVKTSPIKHAIIFVDFSSAYNTVDRELLYQAVLSKRILEIHEVKWLRSLHSRINVKIGGESVRLKNGVHQGSMVSPLLFNVYMEDLLISLEECGIQKDDIFAYADDVAIMCSVNQVERILQKLEVESEKLKLKINKKKSAVMILKGKFKSSFEKTTVRGFPVTPSYKYLGVEIDHRGNIAKHLDKMQRKLNFICSKIAPISYHGDIETRRRLWESLGRPHFKYLTPILYHLRKTD